MKQQNAGLHAMVEKLQGEIDQLVQNIAEIEAAREIYDNRQREVEEESENKK